MTKFVKLVIGLAAYLVFGMFMAVIFIEWMAGCGESYVDAQGSRHYYECVFIPFNHESN